MTSAHNQRVLEQFRVQAATFTDTGFAAAGLNWIIEQLAPRPVRGTWAGLWRPGWATSARST